MKRKNLLIAAIVHFAIAAIVAVFLVAINGCVIYAYPNEVSYPMEMEGDYYGDDYVDLDYAPVYGAGIYFISGHYRYYDGYRFIRHGVWLRRFYTVWVWDNIPYFWSGGTYVQISVNHYHYYDMTVNQWVSAPLPSDSSVYGTPPKKHYKGYPPDKERSHPSGKAIPKTTIPPKKYDHKAFPPDKVGSGPGVPRPPATNQSTVSATPGTSLPVKATPKPSAYHLPVKTAAEISKVSPYEHGSKTLKPGIVKNHQSIHKPTHISPKSSPYRTKSVSSVVKTSSAHKTAHKTAHIYQKSPYLKTGSKKSSTKLKHHPVHKSVHKKGK